MRAAVELWRGGRAVFALAVPALWLVAHAASSLFGDAGGLATVLRVVFDLFVGATAVLVTLLVAIGIAQPIARRSLDALVAALAPMPHAERPASSMPQSLLVTAIGAVTSLSAVGLLETISAVVPEGLLLAGPAMLVVGALALTWDLFDHPLSRRGVPIRARFAWFWQRRWSVLGFAAAIELFALVPGVQLLVLPIGVVAATRIAAAEDDANDTSATRALPS
jgi:hypothetical protein